MSEKNTTHFGFETIYENEKAKKVKSVFNNVASQYDVMNDLMSFGLHRVWKDSMVDWLAPQPRQKLLDVAGGTGDISCRFLNRVSGEAEATILDMTENMLTEGQKRNSTRRFSNNIKWICGDAMQLPFPSNYFDIYTIAFGIRNTTRLMEVLAEAYRVLRIGGRLMILEFSSIPNQDLQKVYDKYSFNVIPSMGKLVVGDRESYKYLVESIRKFPSQEELKSMVSCSGFKNVKFRNLSFGVVALHSGWKI
tara:strand:- start:841 stop:1590 length:750 start_codon:yes stop_codon:yes gene_type:complete